MLSKKIPITPSIILENSTIDAILNNTTKNKWKQFILKPIGSTSKSGFKLFKLNDKFIRDKIDNYLQENSHYSKYICQEYISGFKTFGEIRIYWINGQYSYAVNTLDIGAEYDMIVNPVKDKNRLEKCKDIGKKVINNIPKIIIKGTEVKPVMNRTDFACCLNNSKIEYNKYYLNEIEHQDAGTFTNIPFHESIKYPIVSILADNFVKKAYELHSVGF